LRRDGLGLETLVRHLAGQLHERLLGLPHAAPKLPTDGASFEGIGSDRRRTRSFH
jgi:hypothetical protein